MISILRFIRQKLLIENRLRKYIFYSIGEILLIMVGILLATQVREWNQAKNDRAEERIILTRLREELNNNIERLESMQSVFEKKDIALERVSSAFRGNLIESDSVFLSDVIESSLYGWTVQPLQRLTYNELNNTGRLVIIQNNELRSSITRLYHGITIGETTALARSSDYIRVVYKILPLKRDGALINGLNPNKMADLVDQVLNSELNQHIIYEQNRSRYIQSIWKRATTAINRVDNEIAVELNK